MQRRLLFAFLCLAAACSRDAAMIAADAALPLSPDARPQPPDAGPVAQTCTPASSGNPIVEGWYADPDMRVYAGEYWVFPTYSAPYEQQTFLDAFSSPDLLHWSKHARVLDTAGVSWATRAIWAPSPIARNGKYYLYFGANDIQSDAELGGIGVAMADTPAGPYLDALGHPLVGAYHNGAQPIDQNVFVDDDGQAYLYYGGHGHCNVVRLGADMVSIASFADGSTYKEITPAGYVEGVLMFKRAGSYYLMWSEGGWTGPDYRVAYARASSPVGPFVEQGVILSQDAAVATGSGHNTVVNVPGTDDWYIFYHRHPLGETDGNHRVLAYDRLVFGADGSILPVTMSEQDNFCDGNAIGWSAHGAWSVVDGRYQVDATQESFSLLNDDFQVLDFSARVRVGASGDAGLVFRAHANGAVGWRGYHVGLDAAGQRVFLAHSDGATTAELASAPAALVPGTDYLVHVEASGASLTASVEALGVTLHATDASEASGATGLHAHATTAAFDDVNVGLPEAAIFYGDGGFAGPAVALAPGQYRRAQLVAAGIADDSVSSLRVPRGWRVEMFADDGFTGAPWIFDADAPLVPAEANDQMSSVRISLPI